MNAPCLLQKIVAPFFAFHFFSRESRNVKKWNKEKKCKVTHVLFTQGEWTFRPRQTGRKETSPKQETKSIFPSGLMKAQELKSESFVIRKVSEGWLRDCEFIPHYFFLFLKFLAIPVFLLKTTILGQRF